MASVNSTESTYLGTSYEDYQNEQRVAKSQLGKNDFLKLLVAQLQYQDPLEPTKDSDFVAQLAQFSSLEQMENMSKSMAMMQAYDLVGKYVVAPDITMPDGSKTNVIGTVDSVVCKNGEYYAMIGEDVVKVSAITEVYDKGYVSPESQITNSAHLIGCTVKSYILDAKGNAVYDPSTEPELDKDGNIKVDEDGNTIYKPSKDLTVINGVVTGVGFKDGMAIAYVKTADGKETTVPMHLIFDIRPTETPVVDTAAAAAAAAAAKAEAERLAAEEAERLAAERLAAEEAERLAAERLAAEEAERLAAEAANKPEPKPPAEPTVPGNTDETVDNTDVPGDTENPEG